MYKSEISLINEYGIPYRHEIPETSILFQDKEYPTCIPCARRYLPELGCMWCDPITRKPKVTFITNPRAQYGQKKPRKTFKSIWKQMEAGYK